MRANSTRTKLVVWSGIGLAVMIAVPLLLAAALHDPVAAANRRAIASMTQAEREELERKHQEYLELSAAERQKLRELHEALQRDAELTETRARYEEWSNSLTPWQRLAMRGEPEPEKRLELVREAREEQERRRRREQWELQVQSQHIHRENERYSDGAIRLGRSELAEMMEAIAESLPEPVLARAGVDSVRNADDYVRVLIAALEHHLEDSGEDSRERWPDPALMSKLIARIEDQQDREWFQSVAARSEGQPNLLESLRYGINHAWWRDWWRSFRWRRGSQDNDNGEAEEFRQELERFYAKLPEDEREELQELPAEELWRTVRRRFFEKKRGEFDVRLSELQTLINQMKLRGGFVPLPPDRRPPALTTPSGEGLPRPPRRDDRSRDEARPGLRDGEEKSREPAEAVDRRRL